MKYVGENALKKWTSLVKSDIKKKLDKNQGTANSGKILGVDASGEVAPTDTEVATLVNVPNGIVKGDGSTLSAAVAGIDYQAPLEAGIDYQAPLEDWDNAMLLKNGWARATLPADTRWHSVCYGNGMFVAVADSKDIYGGNIAAYSTDGINWIKTTLPTNAKWQSVCYGNGKFVAVAYLSSIAAYSIDGINWTQSTLPADSSWYSICYGNDKFVAITGYNKNIAAYSTDGINWTKTILPTSAQWSQLCYGNGMFVTVAVGTIAAYSTDGINWTQSTLPDSKSWNSVCYGNGKFVAIAYKDTNGAYSTDGINWTQMRTPTGTSICYGNDKFMIVNYDQTNTWYSTDGTNWTPATMPVGASWTSLCYGGDKFVTVGWESNIAAYFTFSVFNPAGADATDELKTVLRMNEAIAEAKPFVVTLNEDNTTNKTVMEIKAAYDAGRTCVLNEHQSILPLVIITDEMAAFSMAITPESNIAQAYAVIVRNDNRATILLTDFQNMITASGLLKGDGNGGVSAAVAGTDYMTPPTGGITGQVLKKAETGTEWADAPVPDWNQNDSTAVDYVKNRPFYTGGPVETVLIEESTVAFTENSGLYIAQFPSTFEATVGETYKVSWDGTVYECVCAYYNGFNAIGNLSIVGSVSVSDTGEPFLMLVENGNGIQIGTTDISSSHTFSISGTVVPVVKIDPKYLPASFKPEGNSYLTFSSLSSFTLAVENATKNWDGTLEYFASDRTWTIWDGITALSSVDNDGEYVLYLRGTGNTVIAGKNYDYRWVLTGNDIKCIGNIENLLDYATVQSGNHPTMASKCYGYMFAGCNALTKAPDLPATTLASDCYSSMFNGCTSLKQAPALPATTLAENCYRSMFFGCTSLTQASALPATTLVNYCYDSMFCNCTALTQAPDLPATTLESNCYNSMFRGCTSLKQAPVLPATTLTTSCYYYMFCDCTSLKQAPALPATTLADSCYYYMFNGCTSLTQAPVLPATTLAWQCYGSMFSGCTSLKLSSIQTNEYAQEYRIPSSGEGTTANNALTNMFKSTGGTFTGTPEINTTYYLSTDNMIVRETEVATLREYVGSMIEGLATQEYVDGKVPDGGTTGQILKKTETGTEWADAPKSLPDGGTVGDALVKSTNGGSWETPVEASLVDLPVITASQTDLTAGTSPLATGELYVVYE